MDLSMIGLGAEMKRGRFHFEEGYVFLNHVACGKFPSQYGTNRSNHIISSTALMFPIKKMIEECRKRRLLVLIDGAHAPGKVEINREDLCPELYLGNFHEWCAFLWVHKDHQCWCTPLVTSRQYNNGFQIEFCVQGTRDDIPPYFLVPDAIQFCKEVEGDGQYNRVSVLKKESYCSYQNFK